MANKWFSEVFLPSIFDRCQPCNGKWLSQKQTAVCVQNMQAHRTRYDADGYGSMCTHDFYTCEWNGRTVTLDYSKKNGCGCIMFGMSAAEIEVHKAEAEAERKRIKAERVERAKRNPERLAKRLDRLNREIKSWEEEYALDIEDGDKEAAQIDLDHIAKLKEELSLYTA